MSSETKPAFLPYGLHTLEPDDVEAVVRALRDPFLTQGPRIEAFEAALCEATGAAHAVAVSSATAALHAVYAALGVGPGDEVVTSPNTFLSTANAAVFQGARPVFADLEPARGNLDPERVEACIGPRTRALVAVDFAGHPVDYDALSELARRRGVPLVADAAHSLGAEFHGRKVGRLADATCLSFHPVKAVTSGEGGAVLTDDAELARACRRFRSHGTERDPALLEQDHGPWYHEMQSLGWNYRITDFQCALGISQLAKLERFVQRRGQLAQRYRELLAGREDLELPGEAAGVRSAWHLYVVHVPAERRRPVFESLREAGIGVQVHYIPVYRQPYYRRLLGLDPAAFPRAERHYAGAISLPLFPGMSAEDQDRVVRELIRALDRR